MLIGNSLQMKGVESLIAKVARSHSSVLIHGESGTGKELAAKSIHDQSDRHDKPFIVINCAAIPENLLESELFGHEKGAFTGAYLTRRGLFEEAHTGTLFLDEIGDISLPVQAKLLRVLQNNEIRRVGGSENRKVDVRLISATHRNLSDLIQKGLFREDLFYRLNVITIEMPPLRDRKEDIPILSYYFLKKYSERLGKNIAAITSEVMELFEEYSWPGNVRELENMIERATVLSSGPTLLKNHFAGFGAEKNHQSLSKELSEVQDVVRMSYRKAKQKALNLFNRTYISQLLQHTQGNVSVAAQLAGMDRSNFKKIIRKYDVDQSSFRKGENRKGY